MTASAPLPPLSDWPAVLWYSARRFWRDECLAKAAALAFDLLFALIPTIAIGFAILSAFPILDEVRAALQSYIITSFLPQHGEEITALFDLFIQKTRALTAFSVVVLALSALLLFNTVDSVFNRIWRQTAARPLMARLFSFWAIMTAVPLLVAGSVALSTLVARRVGAWGIDVPWISAALVWIAPFLLLTAAFALGYRWLPYRRVRFVHALAGGAVAAALFEGLRWAFSLYVAAFPTFWVLYGALASIPIVLLWIYFFWCLVLFGAELSAALPEWRNRKGADADDTSPSVRRLVAGLLVMERLLDARVGGNAVSTVQLARAAATGLSDADLGSAQELLDLLAKVRIIARAETGWRLARDPAQVTLADLAAALNAGYAVANGLSFIEKPWRQRLAAALGQADGAAQNLLTLPVEALLASWQQSAPARGPGQTGVQAPAAHRD
jgi:membrane protein